MAKSKLPKDLVEVPEDLVLEETDQPSAQPPGIPEAPKQEPSALESAARGLHQGASYGWGDELVGAIGAGAEALGLRTDLGKELGTDVFAESKPGLLDRMARAYRSESGEQRLANENAANANPKASDISKMAGAVMAARLPGMKGASVGRQGLIAGTAFGAGDSEAQDTGGALLDTAGGAVTGYMGGRLMQSIGGRLSPWLKKTAEERAFKAMDPYQKTLEPLMRKSPAGDKMAEARRLGRMGLDEGMVRPFDKSETIARRAASSSDETGTMLEATLQRIQDETAQKALTPASIPGRPVNTVSVGRGLLAKADELAADPSSVDLSRALRAEGEKILSAADKTVERGGYVAKTLPEAEEIKRGIQGLVKPGDWSNSAAAIPAQARMDASRAFKKAVEDSVEGLAGPEDLAQFKALKSRYGRLADIEDVASYGAGRQARNNLFSLGDRQLMQMGAGQGQDVTDASAKALLLALAGKLTRERGSSTAAVLSDALSRQSGAPAATRTLTSDEETRQKLMRLLMGD